MPTKKTAKKSPTKKIAKKPIARRFKSKEKKSPENLKSRFGRKVLFTFAAVFFAAISFLSISQKKSPTLEDFAEVEVIAESESFRPQIFSPRATADAGEREEI
jgi:hypothetical protein